MVGGYHGHKNVIKYKFHFDNINIQFDISEET